MFSFDEATFLPGLSTNNRYKLNTFVQCHSVFYLKRLCDHLIVTDTEQPELIIAYFIFTLHDGIKHKTKTKWMHEKFCPEKKWFVSSCPKIVCRRLEGSSISFLKNRTRAHTHTRTHTESVPNSRVLMENSTSGGKGQILHGSLAANIKREHRSGLMTLW